MLYLQAGDMGSRVLEPRHSLFCHSTRAVSDMILLSTARANVKRCPSMLLRNNHGLSLLKKFKQSQLPLDVQIDMFDKTVLPMPIYGCEI